MTVTASILMIVIGAILFFATTLHMAGIAIDTIGLILMIGGAAGLAVGLVLEGAQWRQARRDVYAQRRGSFRTPPR